MKRLLCTLSAFGAVSAPVAFTLTSQDASQGSGETPVVEKAMHDAKSALQRLFSNPEPKLGLERVGGATVKLHQAAGELATREAQDQRRRAELEIARAHERLARARHEADANQHQHERRRLELAREHAQAAERHAQGQVQKQLARA